MNSVVCYLIISTFMVTEQSKELTNVERLVADESLCRIVSSMSGKETDFGEYVIRKETACECSLPDKNAVMIPRFIGQSKKVVRHTKY